MHLTSEEQAILAGEYGPATRKAMEILTTLGAIYGAERMIPVTSVQISGVSYANLGEAGLEFLAEIRPEDYPIYLLRYTDTLVDYAEQQCFDCRLRGGFLNKPDYWEDE